MAGAAFEPIKFGTDGWRAIIAEDYTFDNVRACAQGVAAYLHRAGLAGRGLLVGYDTRFGSQEFAAAVAEVVAANGIHVYLADRAAPTPAVSYSIIHRQAAGAVIITASHNPPQWNGFKYKPDYAGSASPEVIAELEGLIADAQRSGDIKRVGLSDAEARGTVTRVDVMTPYLQQIGRLVDLDALRRKPLKIVVDSMHGVGAGLFAQLLSGGRAEVTELRGERNPAFPGMEQPEPIAHNLQGLSDAVRASQAHVGLATDGDADRLGVIDEHGRFVTQLQTLALLALYFLEVRGERGALVKSIATTSMLFKLGELYDVPVFETPVGFKYIGPIMIRENALIGGEESGGYGFRGHIPERDGVLSGLYILSMMAELDQRPAQLIDYLYSKVGPHHYDRVDLTFDPGQRQAVQARLQASEPHELAGTRVSQVDTLDGYRFRLEDGSWSLVRFSGTEPLLRIYGETSSPERLRRLLNDTRQLTGV
ncbi:MAG: phosphoglucomutase/phosphomannomutase family protein [Dehalococcoidia bacterium]